MKTNWSSRVPRRGGTDRSAPRSRAPDDTIRIYGWHPVLAALANPIRKIKRLMATENGARRIREQLPALEHDIEIVRPPTIDRMLGPDAVHQGMLLETEPLPVPPLEQLLGANLLIALDQVTDPHNVGAILRSAAAFGAGGLIMTARHSSPLDGVLAKAASGALEHVPVHLARNLGEALQELGDAGFQRVGLAGESDVEIHAVPVTYPVALILGAEGRGLRERTRSLCDLLVRIGTAGPISTLNVSNAAAVSLHSMTRRAASRP